MLACLVYFCRLCPLYLLTRWGVYSGPFYWPALCMSSCPGPRRRCPYHSYWASCSWKTSLGPCHLQGSKVKVQYQFIKIILGITVEHFTILTIYILMNALYFWKFCNKVLFLASFFLRQSNTFNMICWYCQFLITDTLVKFHHAIYFLHHNVLNYKVTLKSHNFILCMFSQLHIEDLIT